METILNWVWSTNVPLLETLVDFLNPDLIVESGIGVYSTPALLHFDYKKYIGIDTDQEWLAHMQKTYNFDSRCELRFHKSLEPILIGTFEKDLKEETRVDIAHYYRKLAEEIAIYKQFKLKLLFVDGATCTRAPAINNAFPAFDIISFHDCEPVATDWYGYYFNKELVSNYNLYKFVSPVSWTGFFIKKELDFDKYDARFRHLLEKHTGTFCKNNSLNINGFNLIPIINPQV